MSSIGPGENFTRNFRIITNLFLGIFYERQDKTTNTIKKIPLGLSAGYILLFVLFLHHVDNNRCSEKTREKTWKSKSYIGKKNCCAQHELLSILLIYITCLDRKKKKRTRPRGYLIIIKDIQTIMTDHSCSR